MAGTGTTRDRVWGSVTNDYNRAFMTTVAFYPYGQLWFYHPKRQVWCPSFIAFLDTDMMYACTTSIEDPPKWTPRINHSHTSHSVLPKS